MKKFFTFMITFIILFCGALVSAQETSALGKALNIKYEDISLGALNNQTRQIIDIKILNGQGKGKIVQLENIIGSNPFYDIIVHPNEKLVLHEEEQDGVTTYFVSDIFRLNVLYFLSGLFCILVILVGRKKGIYSLISIGATIFLIFKILCPLIFSGISPIAATILVCLLSTVITMYLVGGINKKSSSAALGTILSLIIAGIGALLTIKFAHLTGFADETSLYLFSSHPELDFTSITASIIILAALGAVMDVAMSIASTINEIHANNNSLTVKELFIGGMNVGRDIIGTMANTLILVYMGGALPLLLLSGDIDTFKFFNLNTVVTEISSAIIGSTALLLCVPFTAFIAANLIKHNRKGVEEFKI